MGEGGDGGGRGMILAGEIINMIAYRKYDVNGAVKSQYHQPNEASTQQLEAILLYLYFSPGLIRLGSSLIY